MTKSTAVVTRLLTWFAENARDLPWRRTRDPYAIWVSEIMLQQTQVNTVIPYWERWMRTLPDVQSLARVSSARLHKLWEGLGYYSRARNLHHAAQILVDQHQGRMPTTWDEWLALPGIGRYTAGAICSLAFDQPQPILDGNVARVLARLYALSGSPRNPVTNAKLWRLAGQLVRCADATRSTRPPPKPGDANGELARPCSQFNQALMELGALVCVPRNPRCNLCPLADLCRARALGRVDEFPARVVRPRVTSRSFVVFVAERRGRFLVRQRPAGVVNAHLWEFPSLELDSASSDPGRVLRSRLGSSSGAKFTSLCTVHHSITRYRITLQAFRVRGSDLPEFLRATAQWLSLGQMHDLAWAGGHKRILRELGALAVGDNGNGAARRGRRPSARPRGLSVSPRGPGSGEKKA